MQKWISKGAVNSDVEGFEDSCTETRNAKEMDTFQERKKRSREVPEEDDDLLISIDKLVEEVELGLTKTPSLSDWEDNDWGTIWEALSEQIELETEVTFVGEDYERVQQDILDCRNHMEKLLQEIKEAKQEPSSELSDAEEPKGEEVNAGHLQSRDDADAEHPHQSQSGGAELRESPRCEKPFAAEPHRDTTKSKLLSQEKLPTFYTEDCSKLLRWLEAELQKEKMKNKAVQEELEKVKVSCGDEIQKYEAQLRNVRQQLESLQQLHQKDAQKALKEQTELSKQELKKAKAAYEAELQTCKDELKDCREQLELLQRDLRGKGQSSVQLPLDLQACHKDLNTFKRQMDSFRKNARCELSSTESSLFMTGLGSVGMLSSKGMSQSFKNTEKKVRNKVLSLQSELEKSRKETRQEKELCERLQREKESIQMSYKEQQNELCYTKRYFDSIQAQLEDYKKRVESKTEEANHLRKDLKKVKKSCKKKHEKKTRSKAAEDKTTDPPQGDKKKRRVKDDGAQEGHACAEPKKTRKKQHAQKISADADRKASHHTDPQTSPESHKSTRSPQKSTFTMVRDFLGLRKAKK